MLTLSVWNGLPKVLTSILSKICGLCLKVRSMPGNQQIWLNSTNSAKKSGQYSTRILPEAC
ncbi:hypothetical protein LDENG_00179180 [Lucifuga dentata]|nr:hypothetical protein LDENG_00179180 [Lucifuga dentata]